MDKTFLKRLMTGPLLLSAAAVIAIGSAPTPLRAQTDPVPVAAQAEVDEAPQALTPEEMDILVARIALYPDELVALISAASLYPLQIIEAERLLEDSKTKKDLKPKASWDGSVISLMNYPEIVKMMAEDLDWTQLFGSAIVNQQEDVLNAIQQLREQAVANGVIKTDDKVKVTKEVDNGRQNIVIEPASSEVIYVPQYQPEMLYEPSYSYVPVSYYPEPYPYYWNPAATFFAGAVTGAIFTAAVDWDNGFWGWGNNNYNHNNNYWHGGGWGNDVNIDCNKCIIGSDFNGKLNVNNVDWRNVDRSKINYNKNDFNKLSNTNIRNEFKKNDIQNIDRNKLNANKIGSNNKGNFQRPATLPAKGGMQTKDIRKSTLEGLNKKPTQGFKPTDKMARPGNGNGNLNGGNLNGGNLGNLNKPGNGNGNLGNINKPGNGGANMGDKMARPADMKPNLDRPVGKPRPGATQDFRPKTPSPMGEVTRGRDAQMQASRGNKSMGGGGINRPNMNVGGGGGGNFKGGGGGGGGKKFIPPKKGGGGGGGGGRGRRR